MARYSFFKMHGIGNDYIFLDCRSHEAPPAALVAPAWCDRHKGIGGDGIVLILPSSQATVKMRIFNADGSEAQTCGNGLRCIGKYLDDNNESGNGDFTVETARRIVTGKIIQKGNRESIVSVNMGIPVWDTGKIPVNSSRNPVLQESITIDGNTTFQYSCVSMGNPHCVIEVKDVKNFSVQHYGPIIETSSLFPEKTNVEFMQLIDKDTIALRVWERGSGETLACGSGACATFAVWSKINNSSKSMHIHLLGGALKLSFSGTDNSIIQEGSATFAFQGSIEA